MSSRLGRSEGFGRFKSLAALQRVAVGLREQYTWKFYDFGPKDNNEPLLLLHGMTGTAECFWRQMLGLCPRGYRVISAQIPTYRDHRSFVFGLDLFLDQIKVDKVHLFGVSLGAFLAQLFCEARPRRVASLIICNGFADTQYFHNNAPILRSTAKYMPDFVLKRKMLSGFPSVEVERSIADSIDFMVEQLESLTRQELVSRLELMLHEVDLGKVIGVEDSKILIIDTLDASPLPANVREEVHKRYMGAKVALLKSGGDFPFLSRADEINMHIQVHLRSMGHVGTKPPLSLAPAAATAAAAEEEQDTSAMDTEDDDAGERLNETR